MGEASRLAMWVFFFEVQLKADFAYYPPSLKNLLGIRRLGQGWPRSLRACTQETLFLEPVTTITAVRQTKQQHQKDNGKMKDNINRQTPCPTLKGSTNGFWE